jgi:hypothetical protein
MFANTPAFAAVGVPVKAPVVVLKFAQPGLFWMANVKVVPAFASLAVGVKEYAAPAFTDVAGVPEIVGGVFDDVTVMENAASDADAVPSLTLITMLLFVPTCAAPGVPCSRPVVVSKVAHTGRFAIENVSGSLSASAALA